MASSFSSPRNWSFDVFPSFSGEDVRVTFLSHFLKELDRKLIISFKDNETERSESLDPVLKEAIMTSRIAVVVFSEKYPSSSWCLNELVEIVKCQKEYGQKVIPVFYGLDPSHVRKQTGNFGEAFAKTCQGKTEEETKLWCQSLTQVANILGFHSQIWPNEAKMIEAIANDVLGKLNLTQPKDFEDFVGMEDHIAKMSVLLDLESEEVRMVGIWGSSGIGKTSIGRALYSRLSRWFQGSVFIDRAFVANSVELYKNANPDDYNMKLHLVKSFLSEILDNKDLKISSLGAVAERLKHQKILICVDDLDYQMVLDTLVGQTQWFGCGSRIIVITKDKQFLRAHGIGNIYEVVLPSNELALKMFCRFTFGQYFPPDGLIELASEIALCAGNLPLGLKVLGRSLKGRDKEYLMDILPRLQNDLDGDIQKTLRVSYNGLKSQKDKAIFRHISCVLNGEKLDYIKLLLAESGLDVNIGLRNLVDKSLIHVRRGYVEMHFLLQEMGKDIVREQSNEPGEREFLIDAKDISDLLEDNTGTKKVIGVALDMDEIDELHIHECAFKAMRNLHFLKFYKEWYQKRLTTRNWDEDREKEVKWHLPEGFDYLPNKLRLLRFDGYPRRSMPSSFRPENLIKLQMRGSKLERLWEGVYALRGLKEVDLKNSIHLKEIPDFSMATNLEKLDLGDCLCLVEIPSSIQYLNKLEKLSMRGCSSLEILPNGISLQSLRMLDLEGCSRLNMFPDISTNIKWLLLSKTRIETFPSNFRLKNLFHLSMRKMKSEKLWGRVEPLTALMITLPHHSLDNLFLSNIPSLVELPSSIQSFTKLVRLAVTDCLNLKTLPIGITFPCLIDLDFRGCSQLQTFPNISPNIHHLNLSRTGIEEVPWWIENFSKLGRLYMNGCNKLQCVSLHISKLKHLHVVNFSNCKVLTKARWNDASSVVEMKTDNIHCKFMDDASSSFPDNFIKFFNFNVNLKPVIRPVDDPKRIRLSGEKVLSYFTHQTSGMSLTDIPLLQTSLSQKFFRFKACVVVKSSSTSLYHDYFEFDIHVSCRFKGRLGTHFDSRHRPYTFRKRQKGNQVLIFECCFPLNEDNASLSEVNYDHVDIQFHLTNAKFCTSELREWGIRLSDDNNLSDVCEANDNNIVNETEQSEESGNE